MLDFDICKNPKPPYNLIMQNQNKTSPNLLETIATKKALFFDLFHTLALLDFKDKKGVLTCERLGVGRMEWNEQLWNNSRDRLIGKERDPLSIITKLAHNIDPNITLDVIKDAFDNRIYQFEKALINIPQTTLDVLQKLKDSGKKLILISNADVMEMGGWSKAPASKIFDEAIFSCDVGYAKPDPEIYELALKRAGVTPDESVFIGDGGSEELRGAQDAGMTTIMITEIIDKLWPEKIEDRKKDSNFIIKNISELIK